MNGKEIPMTVLYKSVQARPMPYLALTLHFQEVARANPLELEWAALSSMNLQQNEALARN